VLIAVTATAIGYGIDAGHKDLTHVFAGFYIAGCVAAVLAVRQDGIFTTIIQPPLILFCAVPGAYWLFHDGKVGHLKDLLINCGYPLIERFPLMLGTAGGVLAIGLLRWHFGTSRATGAAADTSDDDAGATGADAKSIVSGLVAKLQSLMHPETDAEDADDTSAGARRSRASGPSKARRTARNSRSTTRSSRTRSRHAREGLDDEAESVERPERPRRSARRGAAARDDDAGEPARRPRRRPRPQGDPDPRGQSPREGRREPRTRRNPYERPRSSRFDDFDRYEPPAAPDSGRYEGRLEGRLEGRYERRFGADERYDLYEPSYEPTRRRAAPSGAGPTHHPISQVRYRGAAGPDQPPAEPPGERRSRSRAHGRPQGRPPAESWEYDA
jgi:hypothetical protein